MRFLIVIIISVLLVFLTGPANADHDKPDNLLSEHPYTAAITVLSYVLVDYNTPHQYKWVSSSIFTSATLAADWLLTLDIERHADKQESGLLGDFYKTAHPTRGQVNKYFAGSIIATWLVNYGIDQIPDNGVKDLLRNSFNLTISVMETTISSHNVSIGLQANF